MTLQKEITIAGAVFSVTVPFAEGHVLTGPEAKQLNQVRAENVRNNTAAAVKKLAIDPETKVLEYTEEALEKARELVAAYDAEYDFTAATAGTRRVTDPLERECLTIARDAITVQIKAAGKNVKDIDKEKLAAKIEQVSQMPEIIKIAKSRLKDREKLTDALAATMTEAAE